MAFCMENDINVELRNTNKGQLVYGEEWRSKYTNEKISKHLLQAHQIRSDLSVLKSQLETCEESALAEEEYFNQHLFITDKMLSFKNESKICRQHSVQPLVIGVGNEKIIRYLETTSKNVRDSLVENKTREYEMAEARAYEIAKLNYAESQKRFHQRNAIIQEKLRKLAIDGEENANRIKQLNAEQNKSRKKILQTRLQEAEDRRIMKLQQGKKRFEEAEAILVKLNDLHRTLTIQIESNKTFVSNEKVSALLQHMRATHRAVVSTAEGCREKSFMEQLELDKVASGHATLLQYSHQLVLIIEHIRTEERKLDLERQKQLQIKKAKDEESARLLKAKQEKMLSDKNPELSAPPLPKELLLSVSRAAYHDYLQTKNLQMDYETLSKRFTSNKNNTKLLMAINKAISLPISSITDRSGSDMKSILSDLNGIFKDRKMKVENKHVSIVNDEDATRYAKLFMAKKFVKQAETQVAPNHEAAFGYAFSVLGVWAENEIFGKLFLAQMHAKCPFLIPWHVPKLANQTDADYSRSRGYLVGDNGKVETQDKYLSRMSGLVRAYAAIIQSPLPPNAKFHPYGITEGWKWLARILDLDPWPEVSATILYDFLEVAGYALMKAYGRQFEKLLYSLCHDYFPKLEKASRGGSGGPLQRLQTFLKDCVKSKRVPKPKGHLDESFWGTRHPVGVMGS